MIYKSNIFKLVIFTLLFVFIFQKMECRAEGSEILILYDTYNEFGRLDNKLNSVVKAALSCNKSIQIKKIEENNIEDLDSYKAIIVLLNDSSIINNYNAKLLKYKEKIIFIEGAFTDSSSEYWKLKADIYEKITGNKPQYNKNYILIDKVYPFLDLNAFIKKVDFLHEKGIPFIVSVMPVNDNSEFAAMEKFCEALRYAQSKGGRIVLHSFITYLYQVEGIEATNKMKQALSNYLKYGVYPIALDLPAGWFYKEDYKKLIQTTTTAVIEKDSELAVFIDVLADIGDGQSIEQNLSTFSSHIKNIISIIECADPYTLVIMDEVGAGTDPGEGMGIATAVMEEIYKKGSILIATTHIAR